MARDGFSGQPDRVTCCERCVYGIGEHADWCPLSVDFGDENTWETSGGDPLYCYPGHVDKSAFAAAVHRYEIAEAMIFPGDGPTVDVSGVEHRWAVRATKEEAREHGFDDYFLLRMEPEPGARPVTVYWP